MIYKYYDKLIRIILSLKLIMMKVEQIFVFINNHT